MTNTQTKLLTVFTMLNGQTILAYMANNDGPRDIVVEQPLILMMRPQQNGNVDISLLPMGFPLFADPKTQPKQVKINRAGVSYFMELPKSVNNQQMYDQHRSLFSSIISGNGIGASLNLG